MFRFCWKWRRRSAIKVRRERNEEATEALFAGRESRHPEAAFAGQGAHIEALRRAGAPAHGHNGWVPRDFWLEDWEKKAIAFHLKNPLEGYRRLTFMMLDADIVAVSPTSVWRVLGQAGLLSKWNRRRRRRARASSNERGGTQRGAQFTLSS